MQLLLQSKQDKRQPVAGSSFQHDRSACGSRHRASTGISRELRPSPASTRLHCVQSTQSPGATACTAMERARAALCSSPIGSATSTYSFMPLMP